MTSGMRNKAIDLETAKKENSSLWYEINSNPAAEITWALILDFIETLNKKLIICFKVIGKQQLVLSLKVKCWV